MELTSAPSFVDPSAPVATAAAPEKDLHEQAYHFEPLWQGKAIEAFTMARQAIAAELSSHRMPLGETASNEAYMPNVWAVIWLCLHVPADWAHLRANPAAFWTVIEEWADEGCPRPLWSEAITLVYGQKPDPKDPTDKTPLILGLWEAARLNLITVRRKPGPDLAGNAPRQ